MRIWAQRILVTGLILGSALAGATLLRPASAADLVYQPTSPSFGGSPLNGSYVLGLAGANNYRFNENPRTRDARQNSASDPIQQFRTQITSSLLSQIASQIGQQILGENARDSGTFNLSGTIVDFNRAGGQINVNVRDGASGAQTLIQIPVPNF